MLLAPEMMASRRVLPFIIKNYTSTSKIGLGAGRLVVRHDIIHRNLDALDLQTGGVFDLVLYLVGDALHNGGNVQPVAYLDVQLDGEAAARLGDPHALFGEIAAEHQAFQVLGGARRGHAGHAIAAAGRLADQLGEVVLGHAHGAQGF